MSDIGTQLVRKLGSGVRVRVLGPVTVTDEGGGPLDLGGPKQRTVAAMLIAHAGKPVTADVIVEAVYWDQPHAAARRTVQTYISNLRRQLGDVIAKQSGGWSLDIDASDIDAVRFEEYCDAARERMTTSPEEAGALLREGLSLWRGRPYSDVEAHGYLDGEITRLSELRVSAQASRIESDLAMGRHVELIGELDALITEHPYRERFRAQHMIALYRSGRQKEALRSYSAIKKLLGEELGIEPTDELQDLEQRILEHDPSLTPAQPTTISRKAVLAADSGDAIELSQLSAVDRLERISRADHLLRGASAKHKGDGPTQSGMAIYAFFDEPVNAVLTAREVSLADGRIRVAIDFGEVEISDEGVFGPPVQRAARLLATGHPGQVLLSSETQASLVQSGQSGFRLEALGRFELSGLDEPVVIHQLLVGDPARTFAQLMTDRPPPPLPPGGARPVPGYELHQPVGSGSIGVVYRAYQPALGREVDVEVIGKGEASEPEFIRRFESEAHRLSLLEHPHVLPVLDFWRDTTGAFVVYPHHRGGTLASPEAAFEARHVLIQVASALSYAHGHGLIHGSFHPGGVILDEGGNPYLFGFPLVYPKTVSPDFAAYIPPEHFEGSPATIAGDIYALGVLAHELLAGRPWDPDESLSTNLAPVERATSNDPSRRQTSVEELMAELGLSDAEPAEARFTQVRNPYKGLLAFHEADAADFFGRTAVVEELIHGLASQRAITLVGPSGSGKSSVVRAGLVPALRNGAVPGAGVWVVTDLLPGSQPFRELARAMERVAVDMPPDVRSILDDEDPAFFNHLDRLLPRDSDLLLIVDQFEELFTMTAEPTRIRFLEAMLTAARSDRCRIVMTLRADFLDRPLRYSEFGSVLRGGLVTLGAPNREELAEAVTGPAANVGIRIEPSLVERLVSEVHDSPGALPLLQYTLAELFQARGSDAIALDSYELSGGVTVSLGSRAEDIYSGLPESIRAAAKQILLRLVSVSDEDSPTRRRARMSELDHIDPGQVVEAFVRGRFLVTDRDPVTHTPTVEVAHEALFVHWPRLADWIDELRHDLVMHRRLSEALEDWEASGRSDDYLLSPSRVDQHVEWTSDTELELNDTERDYLERSREWNETQQRRRRHRRLGILVGFAVAALVATWFGVSAQVNARDARVAELLAEGGEAVDEDPELALLLGIAASDLGSGASIPVSSLLHQALLDHRKISTYEWPADRPIGPFLEAALSPDGSTLVATGTGSHVEAWDLAEDQLEWTAEFPEGSFIMGPVFHRDGSRLMIGVGQVGSQTLPDNELGLFVLDAGTGAIIDHHQTGPCGAGMRPEAIDDDWTVVSFASFELPHGSGCSPPTGPFKGVILDLASGERLAERIVQVPHSGNASISPDGTMAAWQFEDSEIEVISLDSSETLLQATVGVRGPSWPVSFSNDGRFLVYGRDPIRIWEIATGQVTTERPGAELPGAEYSAFHDDDQVVVTTRLDGGISIWDPATGADYLTLAADPLSVFASLQGTRLSVSNLQGPRVYIWETGSLTAEIAGVEVCPPAFGRPPGVVQGSLEISESMASVAVYCPDQPLPNMVLFDPETGQVANRIEGAWSQSAVIPWGQGSALSPDGPRAILQEALVDRRRGGEVSVYDTTSGEKRHPLTGWCTSLLAAPNQPEDCEQLTVHSSVFSPDGRLVVVVGGSTSVSGWGVWEVATGEKIPIDESSLGSTPPWPTSVVFSPDGSRLYVSNNVGEPGLIEGGDVLQIYDTSDWSRIVATEPDGLQVESQLGPFAPDGDYLLGVGSSGIALVDAESGSPTQHMGGAFVVADLSDDGLLMATGSRNGIVEVWDFREFRDNGRGVLIEQIPLGSAVGEVQGVRFMGNDELWIATTDGRVQLYTLDPEELLSIARERLTRSFTGQECDTYDIDPCPALADIKGDR